MPTATTAITRLIRVIRTSYRTGLAGTSKPSIAANRVSQTAPPPIDNAAMISQRVRRRRVRAARARPAHNNPRKDPRNATRYAAIGLKAPYVKW
jgi:hypothetical protein